MRECWIVNLGRMDYDTCHALMKNLVARRAANEIPDVLLLVEHDNVITVGNNGRNMGKYLKRSKDELEKLGIKVRSAERGGNATYHGPGQLVAYPIMYLNRYDNVLKEEGQFARDLLFVAQGALAEYVPWQEALVAAEEKKFGLWYEEHKIASVGTALYPSTRVSWHGIAINLNTDLSYFRYIDPCGLPSEVMTSLQAILGKEVDMKQFAQQFAKQLARQFNLSLTYVPREALEGSTIQL